MKKVLFAICLALLLVGCGNSKEDNIVEFQYGYGSYNTVHCNYMIKIEKNKYVLTYEETNSDANVIIKEIKKKDVQKLEKIIKDYELDKWDGFDESDDDIYDGSDFKLNVVYESGETINAFGYMKYPDNYKKGHNALVEFLEKLK